MLVCRHSWLVGYGEGFPDRLWHKLSYNSMIDWPLRGVTIYANWTAQQTTGKFKRLLTAQASKFDMEGVWPFDSLRVVLFLSCSARGVRKSSLFKPSGDEKEAPMSRQACLGLCRQSMELSLSRCCCLPEAHQEMWPFAQARSLRSGSLRTARCSARR